MTKKLYSFNFSARSIERLDKILSTRNINRTAFIQDHIETFINLYEELLEQPRARDCKKCGAIFKGVINCPKCVDKA